MQNIINDDQVNYMKSRSMLRCKFCRVYKVYHDVYCTTTTGPACISCVMARGAPNDIVRTRLDILQLAESMLYEEYEKNLYYEINLNNLNKNYMITP